MRDPLESPRRMNDEETVLRVVEQLAMMLSEMGVPRMAARVFAYVLTDDAEKYTAGELAAGLGVSQAAVSGAVRYLVQAGLVGREREPGARSDHYRVYDDDVWKAIAEQRLSSVRRWEETIGEVLDRLPPGPGRRRLRETQAYLAFMRAELPRLMERWHEHRAGVLAEEA